MLKDLRINVKEVDLAPMKELSIDKPLCGIEFFHPDPALHFTMTQCPNMRMSAIEYARIGDCFIGQRAYQSPKNEARNGARNGAKIGAKNGVFRPCLRSIKAVFDSSL